MSNGAGMSDLIACELSAKVAAIGGVAGAYINPRDACQPDHPVPVIAFHGTDDPIVPYYGGDSRDNRYIFLPVENWAAYWAEHNLCDISPEIFQVTKKITRISYTQCDEDGEVIFYSIEDGGHTWPGGEELPIWIAGKTNQEINASELMWEFYNNHTLNPRE
jgi:polyhydroxybutyrate depolymerase